MSSHQGLAYILVSYSYADFFYQLPLSIGIN